MNDEAERGGWVWIHGHHSSFINLLSTVPAKSEMHFGRGERRLQGGLRSGRGPRSHFRLGMSAVRSLSPASPEYLLRSVTIPSPNNANKVGGASVLGQFPRP